MIRAHRTLPCILRFTPWTLTLLLALPVAGQARAGLSIDDGSHDCIWVRGDTYKASFDARGATYIPFLGSRASRNHPVSLRVTYVRAGGMPIEFDSRAIPKRAGDAVAFDRASFVETYALATDAVEQTLCFDRLPARGDLEVTIALDSDLAPAESATGVELSGESGSVRYGKATVIDAGGRTRAAPTTLEGAAIRIRVPADFLDAARFPVTIDPVLSTFTVDGTNSDDLLPDVAYDATNDRYLAVYEEAFSATDHDVRVRLLNASGGVVQSGSVDISSADWRSPRVANHGGSNQFLVVATETGAGRVHGRTASASNLAMSGDIDIDAGVDPDVGGTPSSGAGAYYLVVWSSGPNVRMRAVRSDGTLVGSNAQNIGNGITGRPRISKSNRGSDWTIVWEDNGDLKGTRIHSNTTVTVAQLQIGEPGSADHAPSVSSCLDASTRYLVVYAHGGVFARNIVAQYMDNGATLDLADLSRLEGASSNSDQYDPATDADNTGFAVSYTETVLFSNESACIATLRPVGSHLHLSEGHQTLAAGTIDYETTSLAGTRGSGGAPGRFMAVWNVINGGLQDRDIAGGLYDAGDFTPYCLPGQDGVAACPCSNPPGSVGVGCQNSASTGGARLSAIGTASLANDTLQFTTSGERPTAFSILFQGTTPLENGVVNGQGVRCAGGTLKRLYKRNAVAGSILVPTGGEQSVSATSAAVGSPIQSGATRYYYVSYRDPVVPGGCPATSTFDLSEAGSVIWRP